MNARRTTPLFFAAPLATLLVASAAPARAQEAPARTQEAPARTQEAPASAAPVEPLAAPATVTSVPAAPAPSGDEAPRARAPVEPKPKRVPLAKRWWFWAGLGTAAAGVLLAALFLGPRDQYTGNAQPGLVPVF